MEPVFAKDSPRMKRLWESLQRLPNLASSSAASQETGREPELADSDWDSESTGGLGFRRFAMPDAIPATDRIYANQAMNLVSCKNRREMSSLLIQYIIFKVRPIWV